MHPTLKLAKAMSPKLVAWRRHLHMHPEPGQKEFETAAFAVERLRELGITEIKTGVGVTGVVALIRGARRGPTVALRADMDSLEMEEHNDVPYRSRKPGLMHACGHDGHVACLLGAGAILAKLRPKLRGNVKLLFQPAEESEGGALKMIQQGAFQNPKVAAVAGLHLHPEGPSGAIGVRRGYFTAQCDSIDLTIIGRNAHAASPNKGVDAISVASQVVTAIQTFIGRHTSALDRKLVTFGQIHGGTRRNVLAERVFLEGTLRTLEPEGREAVLRFLRRDLPKLVGAMGAKMRLTITESYPPLINDDRVVEVIEATARGMLGPQSLLRLQEPSLGGEDFAYFGREGGAAAAMFRLGVRDERKGFISPLHSATFDFDDHQVLPIGAAMLAQTAVRLMQP